MIEDRQAINPMQHSTYLCKINFRETYKGHKLKEGLEELNGTEIELYCAWICEEEERYAGECAMTTMNALKNDTLIRHNLSWIASGDLEILEKRKSRTNT